MGFSACVFPSFIIYIKFYCAVFYPFSPYSSGPKGFLSEASRPFVEKGAPPLRIMQSSYPLIQKKPRLCIESGPSPRPALSLSRNPAAHQAAAGFLAHITGKRREKQQRKCSFHFQLASFFRFMAANLSFTQFVTWAKPLYCV